MKNRADVVALIPARGGSRGLPGKNIRSFHGKPLLAWSIAQARAASSIDRIIVSTDQPEIARMARCHGAEITGLRPRELATDTACSNDVIRYELEALHDAGGHCSIIVLLQPTSPLRLPVDIDEAVFPIQQGVASSVVSVCPDSYPGEHSGILPPDRNMEHFLSPASVRSRRQDLQERYRLNGAIYAADANYFHTQSGFHGPETFAHIMPKDRSVDIDDEVDFRVAEALYPGADILMGTLV